MFFFFEMLSPGYWIEESPVYSRQRDLHMKNSDPIWLPGDVAKFETEFPKQWGAMEAVAPKELANLKLASAGVIAADAGDAIFGKSASHYLTRERLTKAIAALESAAPEEYRDLCAAVVSASGSKEPMRYLEALDALKKAAPAECARFEAANAAYRNRHGSRQAIRTATRAIEAAAPEEFAEFTAAKQAMDAKAFRLRRSRGILGRLLATWRRFSL